VFIMLIFFIVVASFLKEAGIEVNRPDSNANPPETDATSISVTITGDDQIWMENRRIDIRAVRANIARLLAADPEQSFTVKTESGASVGVLLEVGDAAREAGVKQVNWPAEEKK
jgi:biopolymer transport protein ExbD